MAPVTATDIDCQFGHAAAVNQGHIGRMVEASRVDAVSTQISENTIAVRGSDEVGDRLTVVDVETPYLAAHVSDKYLVGGAGGVVDKLTSVVLLQVDHPNRAGHAVLHLAEAGAVSFPDERARFCVHDVQCVAHIVFPTGVGSITFGLIILAGVIAASEDQDIGNICTDLDLGAHWCGPGLAEALKARCYPADDLPQEFGCVPIGYIQRIQVASAPTHGGVGVHELTGLGGSGRIKYRPITICIICPDRHCIVHAVRAAVIHRAWAVFHQLFDVRQQSFRYEGELLNTCCRVDYMDHAFVSADNNGAVVRFVSNQARARM